MKKLAILLLIFCTNVIAQNDAIKQINPLKATNQHTYKNVHDSLSIHIIGNIFEANSQEGIPFVIVTCASYKTETNLDGNYELIIPISQIKLMSVDSLSIAYQYPSYCIPTIKIGTDKLIQIVNNKGTLCGIEINGEPKQNQQELLIDK